MIAHGTLSAGLGAKFTALIALVAGLILAAWEAGGVSGVAWPGFPNRAVALAPIGLLGGALAGLILFFLIGFAVALLGVKRVGWTFTYTTFGAILFALSVNFLQPLIESASETFAGPSGIAAAAVISGLIGAASGYLLAGALKDAPTI